MVLVAVLMLFGPGVVYLATWTLSGRLRPGLRKTYRFLGAILVFPGSGISWYFAAYTGDQGGITAYFFQLAVILHYLLLSVTVVGAHYLGKLRG